MFKQILVPLDGSELAECVIPHALSIARVFGARLILIRVLDRSRETVQMRPFDSLSWHMNVAEAMAYLEQKADVFRKGGIETTCEVLEGSSAERIVQYTQIKPVDLIILSSHGMSGVGGWSLSSVVQQVLLRIVIPAMIIRAHSGAVEQDIELSYQNIFVPLDMSQRAECALPVAIRIARQHRSLLYPAHVVSKPEMPRLGPVSQEDEELSQRIVDRNFAEASKYIEQLKNRLQADDLDIQPLLFICENTAVRLHQLVDENNIDLVVLSAHGYTSHSHWPIGSIVSNFMNFGKTPLLVLQDMPKEALRSRLFENQVEQKKGH